MAAATDTPAASADPAVPSAAPGRFDGGLGATFHRLWVQRGAVNLADGVLLTASGLLAVGVTRSPFQVSLVAASATLPWLFATLPAGVLADRYDRRLLMGVANLVRVAALVAGVALVLGPGVSIPLLCGLALVLGVAEVLHDTVASTLVPAVVPRALYEKANGRLLVAEQVANSFLGAPLAGPLVALGAAWALGVPALLYAAGALLLLGLHGRFRAHRDPVVKPSARRELAEGVRFVFGHRVIRTLTLVAGFANAANSAYFAVFVLWVVGPGSAMGLSPQVFGLLISALALGAVLGPALAGRVVARFGSVRLLQPTWMANALLMALPVLVPSLWVAVPVFVLLGVTNVMGNVMQMSMRQRMIPEALLGRAGAVGRLIGRGLDPIGALAGGALATVLGLEVVFLGAVVVVLLGQAWSMAVVTPAAAARAQDDADRADAAAEAAASAR